MIPRAKFRTSRHVYFLSGVTLIVPSKFSLIIFAMILIMLIFSRKNYSIVNSFNFVFLMIVAAVSVASIIPSVALGDPEAYLFLQRFLACAFVSITALMLTSNKKYNNLELYISGVFLFTFINATFVILTALRPDIYELLQIERLSGFNASIKRLRSPGLVAGFDYAGLLSTLGLIISFWWYSTKSLSFFRLIFFSITFLVAIILSSRFTMIAAGVALLMIFFDYKVRGKASRLVLLLFASPILYIGVVLSLGLLDASYIEYATLGHITYKDIEVVYNLGSVNDYLDHYDLSNVEIFASESLDFYPDNFYFRLLYSGGTFAAAPVFFIITIFCSMIFLSQKGEMRIIYKSFIVIIVIMSAKTNYFFYLPLWFLMVNMFIFRKHLFNPNGNA
tara:strand:- start:100 stop:1272 length:1173 start_codon:yes stop_codon:yes gene_type:complete